MTSKYSLFFKCVQCSRLRIILQAWECFDAVIISVSCDRLSRVTRILSSWQAVYISTMRGLHSTEQRAAAAHTRKNEHDSSGAYKLLKLSRAPVLSSCPQWRWRYFKAKEMDRHSITSTVSAQYINVFITHCPAKLTFLKWPWKMSCI